MQSSYELPRKFRECGPSFQCETTTSAHMINERIRNSTQG